MTPIFADDALWVRAAAEIDSWMGTPYRHLWMVKGRGADCTLWIGAVMKNLGLIRAVRFKPYPPDWFANTRQEFIRDTFAQYLGQDTARGIRLVQLPKDAPLLRGDVMAFSLASGAPSHHSGIMLDPPMRFAHSWQRRGVIISEWGHSWARRMNATYRLVQK